jgi:putative ABC transport system permease protein
MASLFRSVSVRYWRRHHLRTTLVVASIALGVGACTATRALTGHLDRTRRAATTPLAGFADLHVSNGDSGVPGDLGEQLAKVPGVQTVRPLIVERALVPDLDHQPALLIGIDLMDDAGHPIGDVTINDLNQQSYLRSMLLGRQPVIVGRELGRLIPSETGRFDVLVGGRRHRCACAGTITEAHGPAATLAGRVLVLPCGDAAALLDRPDLVSRFDVTVDPGADLGSVRRNLEALIDGKAQVWSTDAYDQRTQEMFAGLFIGLSLCGAAALVVGLFLIYNTLAVSVAERRRDIGILRAIGATREQIGRLFITEALVLGVMGSLIGLPFGVGVARFALSPMRQVLSDVFFPLEQTRLVVPWSTLSGAWIAGVLTTLAAAIVPALQAACNGPIETIRRTPRIAPLRRLQILAIVLLLASGLACGFFKNRLPAHVGTFGALAPLLAAALIAVPLLAAALARCCVPMIQRVGRLEFRLAMDNLVRDSGRTGLVTAAIAAGVALSLLTAGLIRSNEDAIQKWVDHSIAGDLFVTAGGPLSASGQMAPMPEGVGGLIRECVPEASLLPMCFRYLDWHQGNHSARLLLLALDAPSYFAANKERQPPLPDLDLYQRLSEQPDGTLVSENFAALYGLHAGDRLTLPGSDGPVQLCVLGTVADYSCNRGTVIVDRSRYTAAFHAESVDVFDLYLPAHADREAVRQRIQQSPWGAGQALCVLTRNELRDHITGMVHRLYGLAYSQELVVGIVAMLGVVAALVIAVIQRQRELGLLRALGATRRQLLTTVLGEAIYLGLLGTGVGLVAGIPLEWYTIRLVLIEETGFVFPVLFPWIAAGTVAAITLGSVLLAGLGPGIHTMRLKIVEAIAYE